MDTLWGTGGVQWAGGKDTWGPTRRELTCEWRGLPCVPELLNNHLKYSFYILCCNRGTDYIHSFYKCLYLRTMHHRWQDGVTLARSMWEHHNGCHRGAKVKCRIRPLIQYSHVHKITIWGECMKVSQQEYFLGIHMCSFVRSSIHSFRCFYSFPTPCKAKLDVFPVLMGLQSCRGVKN